ncbi:O-methyltransferase [Paraburkholderia sp.]|uniref:O-methyltransferase n=1 Tax=Paraburkholderia sp. TaxID=1926495 RepID=UPI002394F384|nr:O-methyltransferase [Paraburkholderia sp.]MDE1181928.1 O-methyltransferase [Paraburkholderia sp.]
MNQPQWTDIDAYLNSKLLADDATLDAALTDSEAACLPSIGVAPNQGKMLNLMAQMNGARRILEVGTLGGYSTIWLARALPEDGRLISLELNPDYAAVARRNLERADVSNRVSVVVGPAKQSLETLLADKVEPFDMVFLDADKKSYPDYLRLSLALCRPGSVIISDNVIRRGRIADRSGTDPDVVGLHTFFDMLGTNPRLQSTAVQTVGAKGWDGFSITRVSA